MAGKKPSVACGIAGRGDRRGKAGMGRPFRATRGGHHIRKTSTGEGKPMTLESAGFGSVEGSSGTTPFGAGSSNIISSSEPDSAETVSSNKSVATLEILLLLLLRAPLNHQLLRFPRCW